MKKSERDSLIIKRDGLLKLKRVIDVIDKLRQIYPKKDIYFKTKMNKFVDALGVYEFNDISALFRKANSLNIGKFTIYNDGNEGWGSNTVDIIISNDFERISEKIRSEYHKINDLIPKGKQLDNTCKKQVEQGEKIIKENSWWKLTHPLYLIFKALSIIKKYPKISVLIFTLIILFVLVYFNLINLDSINVGIFTFKLE